MPTVINADAIRIAGSHTLRFEGRDHGSGVSFFLVNGAPGTGPDLHRHPYSETWTVLSGEATITIGKQKIIAHAGDTAVVAPMVWHGFKNTGTDVLQIICIHASDTMIQENL